MEDQVRPWIESLIGHPSCLACAVRRSDQPSIQRCWDETLSAEALEYASRSVADLFRVLRLHKQPSRYLQWTFEQGILHCLHRDDDWLLVVAARRDPPLPADRLTAWVQSFLELA